MSCQQVNMQRLKNLLMNVSPDVVVSIRGRHAVGKSEAVAQFAAEKGLPLVMRRLSQMTEGDMLGIPVVGDPTKGTSFTLCEWFLEGCEKPVVLFLDERNRALDQVKQSIFEVCDSRQLYGRKLHPGTYVVIAENVGDSYQVQQCDPAEVSRTVTVELEPSFQEWLDYAQGKCHPATIEFVRSEGQKVLEFIPTGGASEPNKKYADRRSWFKLDVELARPRADGKNLMDHGDPVDVGILACGFLGTEVGNKFSKFLKEREKQVSAADILTDWAKVKARLTNNGKSEISNEVYVELGNKMTEHFAKEGKKKLGPKRLVNFEAFVKDMPGEPAVAFICSLAQNLEVMQEIAPVCSVHIAMMVSGQKAREEAEAAAKASAKK